MGSSELFHFTPSPLSSSQALVKKASHSLILLPGFSSYRQIQCSWSPAVAVLTLSSSLLWNKEKKGRSFLSPLSFFPPRRRGGWRGGGDGRRQLSSHFPSPRAKLRPLQAVPAPSSAQSLRDVANETVFFKRAKVSRVWNRSSDTVNVPGLPHTTFNQILNTHCITSTSLAQWQLPHHSPLFPRNIDCREAPSPLLLPPEVRSNYVYIFFFPLLLLLLIYLASFFVIWSFFSFIILTLFITEAIMRLSPAHMLCEYQFWLVIPMQTFY